MTIFGDIFLGAHSGWLLSFWIWMQRRKLSLKLHMNIVQNLLLNYTFFFAPNNMQSFLILFNLVLHTSFFVKFFSCYLFVNTILQLKKGIFSISPVRVPFVGSAKYLIYIYIYIYIYIFDIYIYVSTCLFQKNI